MLSQLKIDADISAHIENDIREAEQELGRLENELKQLRVIRRLKSDSYSKTSCSNRFALNRICSCSQTFTACGSNRP